MVLTPLLTSCTFPPARTRLRRLLIEQFESRALLAVDFEPVKALNPNTQSSTPDSYRILGSTMIFRAQTELGTELWKSDGTVPGTTLLKDVFPGTGSSNPGNLTIVGSTLYFSASNGTQGTELWKTDGTEAGTVLVKDISPGITSSNPTQLVNVGGTLYFAASDGTNGSELWKSDGTASGTVLIKDINPGALSSNLSFATNLSGFLIFSANDGTAGYELWRSDGTSAGTTRIVDLNPGSAHSSPRSLTQVGSNLFFAANDGTNGIELWKTGGTVGSTSLVKNINTSGDGYPSYLTNANGVLYFAARSSNGMELWSSDGTNAGTINVKDIRSGLYGSYPSSLTNVGSTLYFAANDSTNGKEFWKSDGTSAGTVMVQNVNGVASGSYPTEFTSLGGNLFFAANGLNGRGLWKYDGATTTLVKQPSVGGAVSQLTVFGGALFFTANDSSGSELWRSDGTAFGTNLFKDINPRSPGANVTVLAQVNDKIFFTATTSDVGGALWVSDGTAQGTSLVKDINSGSTAFFVPGSLNVNGTLFFSAFDPTGGYELWRSDGTTNGTVRVKDIRAGTGGSYPRYFTNVNGLLFFTAGDATNGYELWRSDGSESGTILVKNIRAGADPSNPTSLTNANGILMFQANDGTNGVELWRSDGSSSGTSMVKNIHPTGNSYPTGLSFQGGKLYFTANDGSTGAELWTSDGTAAGTSLLSDIQPGAIGSFPSGFISVANKIYFTASDANGLELWSTNGTALGTTIVKDIVTGPPSSLPGSLTNFNNTLYFTASSGSGRELWKSDGTASGTVQAVTVNSSGSSQVYQLMNVPGNLVFTATNGLVSRVYTSNGTTPGTVPLLANSTLTTQAPQGSVNLFFMNSKVYGALGDLLQVRSNVDIDLTSSTTDRNVVVRKTTWGIEVVDQASSTQLAFVSNLAMASVQSLTFSGSDSFNEAITIDYQSGGFFSFPAGINVVGGSSGGDTLTITGTTAQRLQWETQASASSATFKVLQQNSSSLGSVSGIETITTSGFLSATAVNLLQAGPPNLLFNNPGTLLLAPTTQIGGGTLSTTSVASLAPGSVLTGTGSMSGRFSGDIGSAIMPTGNMSIGLNTSSSGFITRGDLVVDVNSVSLLDANEAVLGSQTTLGNGATPGTLTATNGLLVDFGNNVNGYGTINTPNLAAKPFTMNGSIAGTSVANPVTLTGYIKGVGNLTNVSIAGTYSPGFSPAAVTVGSLNYAATSTTVIEIGGTSPGTMYDQINHQGSAVLGGTLNVQLINAYAPSVGDSFTIMTATGGFSGSFDTQVLPTPPLGAGWNLVTTTSSMILQLVDLANVNSTQFGDGTSQRSRIDQLVVTFQGAVDLDVGAFGLLKRGVGGGSVATSFTTSTNTNGDTLATISFSGPFTRASGALVDGYYQLTIDSTKVRRAGTQLTLDGDSDGLAGGNFVRGTIATDNFFAYFGDTSGDTLVGVAEFGQFRASFGKLPTDAGYNALFDYDGGGVGVGDFGQFRSRFGQGLSFS